MKVKLKIVLLSHLGDIPYDLACENFKNVSVRAAFCKHLIFHFPDTNQGIDVDAEFKKFQSERGGNV
jgi:hypothetical protein